MDYIYTYKNQVNKMCIDLDKENKRKLALMCIERQFKTYEHLASNKEWDKRVEYRELLDECWSVILEDAVLEEDVWEKHEEIKPESVNKKAEEFVTVEFAFANVFASNMEAFIDMLLDDDEGEESFLLFNINFIVNYVNEIRTDSDNELCEKLVEQEKKNQLKDIETVCRLENMADVKGWYLREKSLVGWLEEIGEKHGQ